MSHEIRTPLNAIIGFSDMICQMGEEEEKQEYMKIVSSNNELLLQLIDDILDLSKIEAGTMEFTFAPTDINELMEGICRQMQEKNTSPDVAITFTEKATECIFSYRPRTSFTSYHQLHKQCNEIHFRRFYPNGIQD